jgi:hypothetical protein
MLDLTEQPHVNDWMYLQMQGIVLYTAADKEVHWKHETTWNKKILECTGNKKGASANGFVPSQGMD